MLDQPQQQGPPQVSGPQSPLLYSPPGGSGGGGFQPFQQQQRGGARQITKNPQNMFQVSKTLTKLLLR